MRARLQRCLPSHERLELVAHIAGKGRSVDREAVGCKRDIGARLGGTRYNSADRLKVRHEVTRGRKAPGDVATLLPRAAGLPHASLAVHDLDLDAAVGLGHAATTRPESQGHAVMAQVGVAFEVQVILATGPPDVGHRRARRGHLCNITGKMVAPSGLHALPGTVDRIRLCLGAQHGHDQQDRGDNDDGEPDVDRDTCGITGLLCR